MEKDSIKKNKKSNKDQYNDKYEKSGKNENYLNNNDHLKFNMNNINSEYADVDPSIIYYQHSKIKPEFSDHKLIEDTIEELKNDIKKIINIPKIQVLLDKDGFLFSLNNRRLYVFKCLKDLGLIKTVNVRIKIMNDKEKERYNREKCSLNAKFMYKIKNNNDENNVENFENKDCNTEPLD